MKWVKIIGIGIGAIVGIVLLVAGIAPSDYAVERSVTIGKSSGEVFDYISLLKNQDNYSAWAKMDPQMKKTFNGQDGTVGFVSAWKSSHEKVGEGEQEIMKISEGKRVDYELRFFKPFEATDQAYITTKAEGAKKTKVTWGFSGSMAYPMNLMLLFMNMDEMLGDQLNEGLLNLKGILEK